MIPLKALFVISLFVSLYCLGDIIFLLFFFETMEGLYRSSITGSTNFWLERIVNITNNIGVFSVTFGLWQAIQKTPFESKASLFLKMGGLLFLIASLLFITSDLYNILLLKDQSYLVPLISTDIMLLIIGVATLFIADVLESGILLKQENDLTI